MATFRDIEEVILIVVNSVHIRPHGSAVFHLKGENSENVTQQSHDLSRFLTASIG